MHATKTPCCAWWRYVSAGIDSALDLHVLHDEEVQIIANTKGKEANRQFPTVLQCFGPPSTPVGFLRRGLVTVVNSPLTKLSFSSAAFSWRVSVALRRCEAPLQRGTHTHTHTHSA